MAPPTPFPPCSSKEGQRLFPQVAGPLAGDTSVPRPPPLAPVIHAVPLGNALLWSLGLLHGEELSVGLGMWLSVTVLLDSLGSHSVATPLSVVPTLSGRSLGERGKAWWRCRGAFLPASSGTSVPLRARILGYAGSATGCLCESGQVNCGFRASVSSWGYINTLWVCLQRLGSHL